MDTIKSKLKDICYNKRFIIYYGPNFEEVSKELEMLAYYDTYHYFIVYLDVFKYEVGRVEDILSMKKTFAEKLKLGTKDIKDKFNDEEDNLIVTFEAQIKIDFILERTKDLLKEYDLTTQHEDEDEGDIFIHVKTGDHEKIKNVMESDEKLNLRFQRKYKYLDDTWALIFQHK